MSDYFAGNVCPQCGGTDIYHGFDLNLCNRCSPPKTAVKAAATVAEALPPEVPPPKSSTLTLPPLGPREYYAVLNHVTSVHSQPAILFNSPKPAEALYNRTTLAGSVSWGIAIVAFQGLGSSHQATVTVWSQGMLPSSARGTNVAVITSWVVIPASGVTPTNIVNNKPKPTKIKAPPLGKHEYFVILDVNYWKKFPDHFQLVRLYEGYGSAERVRLIRKGRWQLGVVFQTKPSMNSAGVSNAVFKVWDRGKMPTSAVGAKDVTTFIRWAGFVKLSKMLSTKSTRMPGTPIPSSVTPLRVAPIVSKPTITKNMHTPWVMMPKRKC